MKQFIKRILGKRISTKIIISRIRKNLAPYYLEKLKNANLIIFSGAGTLKWDVRLNFGPYYDVISRCAEKLGIPCVINSVGVESKYSQNDYRCRHFSKVLSRDVFKIITTRDDITELKKYVKNENTSVYKIADVGIWASETYDIQRKEESNIIGIGIITYRRFEEFHRGISKDQYEKTIKDIIAYFDENGIKWQIFTNGDDEDNEYAKNICNILKTKQNLLIPSSPKELVSIISQFKGIVTSRLHSCIVAYSLNIPFINICWNNKIKYFCQQLGIPERVIESDRLDSTIICKELKRALEKDYDQEKKQELRLSDIKAIKSYLSLIK